MTYTKRGPSPSRGLVITDKGRRALLYDWLHIPLPISYHAWGSRTSTLCPVGHNRKPGTPACNSCTRATLPKAS
jgi:hypothetical protein